MTNTPTVAPPVSEYERQRQHFVECLRQADAAFTATEPEPEDGDWLSWVRRKTGFVKTWLYDIYQPLPYQPMQEMATVTTATAGKDN